MIKLFITGTDTNVGKTYTSILLLKQFKHIGYSTIAIKPIASGCSRIGKDLLNQDALNLQKTASIKLPYNQINPFAFKDPIAPHLAAQREGIQLNKHEIIESINRVFLYQADIYLIEGIGGWLVPINNNELVSDVAKELNIPVILVVGIKLGCLNHAILTTSAIANYNIPCLGLVANCIQAENKETYENIATLKNWLKYPYLGTIPYKGKLENYIDVNKIIKYFYNTNSLL